MAEEPRELQPVTFLGKDPDSFIFTDFTPRTEDPAALEQRVPADMEPDPEDLAAIERTGLDAPPEDPDQLTLDLEAAVREATEAASTEAEPEPAPAPKVPPA